MKTALQILIFALLATTAAIAATASSSDTTVQQKAKAKAYPGGKDDEPLQVQAQLSNVGRKMQPAQEPVEVPDEVAEPAGSND